MFTGNKISTVLLFQLDRKILSLTAKAIYSTWKLHRSSWLW